MTQAVAKTNGDIQTTAMSQAKAMYLLKTVWPQAPEVEVQKAAIICATYGLNPLLKQVSIIKFGQQYVTVLGIKATRNIALGTGHKWSYIDGPRMMTDAEQKAIFGEVDGTKQWAICKIRDEKGNEYPGYGFWTRGSTVYGEDKGNSPINMAFIRAERNALDKMAPGELPNAEVTDESFMPVENFGKAIEQGRHESAVEAEQDIATLWELDEAPSPLALISESKASDIKAKLDEYRGNESVKAYFKKYLPGITKLRQLTNEQADALLKYINTIK